MPDDTQLVQQYGGTMDASAAAPSNTQSDVQPPTAPLSDAAMVAAYGGTLVPPQVAIQSSTPSHQPQLQAQSQIPQDFPGFSNIEQGTDKDPSWFHPFIGAVQTFGNGIGAMWNLVTRDIPQMGQQMEQQQLQKYGVQEVPMPKQYANAQDFLDKDATGYYKWLNAHQEAQDQIIGSALKDTLGSVVGGVTNIAQGIGDLIWNLGATATQAITGKQTTLASQPGEQGMPSETPIGSAAEPLNRMIGGVLQVLSAPFNMVPGSVRAAVAYPYTKVKQAINDSLMMANIDPTQGIGREISDSYSNAGLLALTAFSLGQKAGKTEMAANKNLYDELQQIASIPDKIKDFAQGVSDYFKTPDEIAADAAAQSARAEKFATEILQPKIADIQNAVKQGKTLPEVQQFIDTLQEAGTGGKTYQDLIDIFQNVNDAAWKKISGYIADNPDLQGDSEAILKPLQEYYDSIKDDPQMATQAKAAKAVLDGESSYLGDEPPNILDMQRRKMQLDDIQEPFLDKVKSGTANIYTQAKSYALDLLRQGYRGSIEDMVNESTGGAGDIGGANKIWGSTDKILSELSQQQGRYDRSVTPSDIQGFLERTPILRGLVKGRISVDNVLTPRSQTIFDQLGWKSQAIIDSADRAAELAAKLPEMNAPVNGFYDFVNSNIAPATSEKVVNLDDMDKTLATQRVQDILSIKVDKAKYDAAFDAQLKMVNDILGDGNVSVSDVQNAAQQLQQITPDLFQQPYAAKIRTYIVNYLLGKAVQAAPELGLLYMDGLKQPQQQLPFGTQGAPNLPEAPAQQTMFAEGQGAQPAQPGVSPQGPAFMSYNPETNYQLEGSQDIIPGQENFSDFERGYKDVYPQATPEDVQNAWEGYQNILKRDVGKGTGISPTNDIQMNPGQIPNKGSGIAENNPESTLPAPRVENASIKQLISFLESEGPYGLDELKGLSVEELQKMVTDLGVPEKFNRFLARFKK